MEGLSPIRRSPLYEEVVERVRQLIEIERLQPGDRLPPERDLAGLLGVSRTSVRQAITVLRVMGVVAVKHGDGVYLMRNPSDVVPPLDRQILDDDPQLSAVNDVREATESHAARLAARRRTDADLVRLKETLEDMRDDVDRGGSGRRADRRFHAGVLEASHSPGLQRLIGEIGESVDRISEASLDRPGQSQRSLDTHCEIVDAIIRRDEEAAYQLMLNHLAVTGTVEGLQVPATPSLTPRRPSD